MTPMTPTKTSCAIYFRENPQKLPAAFTSSLIPQKWVSNYQLSYDGQFSDPSITVGQT